MPAGRPRIYTDKIIDQLIIDVNEYTNETSIPILVEFAYQNNIPKRTLYDLASKHEELLHSINKLVAKKESQLERLGLTGGVDKTMAIFSLKQLGWKDKQELQHTGRDGGPISIKPDLGKLSMEELKNLERIISRATPDAE